MNKKVNDYLKEKLGEKFKSFEDSLEGLEIGEILQLGRNNFLDLIDSKDKIRAAVLYNSLTLALDEKIENETIKPMISVVSLLL